MTKPSNISNASKDYLADLDEIGLLYDQDHWNISPQWAAKFRVHLEALKVAGAAGDSSAYYYAGHIYQAGSIYSSESEAIAHCEQNTVLATQLWLNAAKAGHSMALDSLISCGVGAEADRIRMVYKQSKNKFQNTASGLDDLLVNMKILHRLLYND